MSLYVGINNTPKSIVSLLIGASDENKEIQNAYTGGLIQRV